MPHITMVTLGVSDLDRTTAFYEAWGWERSSASVPGTVTFFHGSTAALALFGRAALAAEAQLETSEEGAAPAIALAMNLPSPDDVDRSLERAGRAGGAVVRPAAATEWGGYSGYVQDPEGHLWEVAHNPHFPLRTDGGTSLPRDV
jgi:uncharacterized protein